MESSALTPHAIKQLKGVNDNISPIVKEPNFAEVLDNFELAQDFSLTTRLGSILVDRAARLRMANLAAFKVDEYIGRTGGNIAAGTYHYIGRFYDPIADEYTLPYPTRTVIVANANATVLVQLNFRNNPDNTRFTEFHLYRTEVDADDYDDPYYRVKIFTTEAAAETFAIWEDTLADASITGNPSVLLNDDDLGVDHPVSDIIDFKRRIGGNDILYVSGKYIKSHERLDAIYDEVSPDRLGSHVIYQNAVFYVNGKDFLLINSRHQVFPIGGPGPTLAPNISRISGPLTGTYRYVFTWYDDGSSTEHPWESNSSPVSDTITLLDEGVLVEQTGTPPARATHWRIYRTTSEGAIADAKLVAQVPIATTTYVDTKVDIVIGPDVAPFDYNDSPADLKLRFIWKWADRLYGAGNPDSPSTVYFSEPGKPEQWSELFNRITLEEDDGDPVNGGAVVDGKVIAFKKDSVYILEGDPPISYNKLGFKQGSASWRCTEAANNGAFVQGENSVYFFDGNAMHDIGDYISQFIQNRVNATEGTLQLAQMVDYQLPTKKQLIVSFRTMGEGTIKTIAGVYHYILAKKVQDDGAGWTFFKNWKCTSMAIIEDTFDKDMLYLGIDDGRVFQHDRMIGEDRAEIENMGAAGAPFINPEVDADDIHDEPWDDLDDWSAIPGDGSTVIEENPAGVLHWEDPSANSQLTPVAGHVVLSKAVRITFTDLNFAALINWDSPDQLVPPLFFRVQLADEENVSTEYMFGFTADNFVAHDFGNAWISLDSWTLALATDHDIIVELFPSNSDAFPQAKHVRVTLNGVVTDCGLLEGDNTGVSIFPGFTYGIMNTTGNDELGAPVPVEFTLANLKLEALGNDEAVEIDHKIDGDQIEYVYETPWMSLDDQDHLQKFVKWAHLVLRANFNGNVKITLFSDLVLANGDEHEIPVNGGSLWDVMEWGRSLWDGLKQSVVERVGVSRTGNHIKFRLEIKDIMNAYVELFGVTLLANTGTEDTFTAPRGNEGVSEGVSNTV